ncbi:hypothetical protein [Streptomyces sp. Inha503]|uniref:hypothetical protein n=1 Tax=Streptomyces sp. Inha503 TaxID=3383314 RepID=UPI00399FEC02
MPGFRINTNVNTNGPMFDGRAQRAANEYADQLRYRIATEAEDMVRARLQTVLKHPTGYYESHIRVERAGNSYEVTDGGVVYGPWLEGTGSRNFPVTRFRGYATFRRVKAMIDRRAGGIAQRLLQRYIRRM